MVDIRRSWAQLALLALAVIGVGVSIYLTAVHYQAAPLACSTSGLIDCSRVLSSAYSVIPGTKIPISVPGLFWFIVAGALASAAAFRWPDRRNLRIAMLAWTLLGMLSILYLIYVELVLLHTICIWCTALHITIFAMFLIAVTQLQVPEWEEEEAEEEGEVEVVNTTRD